MSDHDEATTVMRAYSAGRDASKKQGPTATEIVVGSALLLVGLGCGVLLILHHGHGHVPQRWAWFFVGFCLVVGTFCVIPFRLEAAWREIRSAAPFLRAPGEGDRK